jgi:hypothetical protein
LNTAGYFDHLGAFLEHAMDQQFVRAECGAMIMMESSAAPLLDRFAAYRAPRIRKWIGPEET